MYLVITTFESVQGKISTLDSSVKSLIVCKDKKAFIEIQLEIITCGKANLALPLMDSGLSHYDLERKLIALGLCKRIGPNLQLTNAIYQSTNSSSERVEKDKDQKMLPLISILIRQWDAYNLTATCIESIRSTSYYRKKIVMIDDASKDESYLQLFLTYLEVHIIRSLDKLEYCNSFNLLAKYVTQSADDYIFIVNNDTKDFSTNIFEELIANSNELTGMISSRVKDFQGNFTLAKDRKWLGIKFNVATEGYMIKLSVWNEVGGFNSSLIRYAEDLEIAIRMESLGLHIKRVDSVYFAHLSNGSSSKQNFIPVYYLARNLVWIQKIYFPEKSLLKMVWMSLQKTWKVVTKKNSLTGKRHIILKITYLAFGLIFGIIKNCSPNNPNYDPFELFNKPPLRFIQNLR